MESDIRFLFEYLFEEGYNYRYFPERWRYLKRFDSLPYPSPWRIVHERGMSFVEELMQPTVLPRLLSPQEISELKVIAKTWAEFVIAQEEVARTYPGLLQQLGSSAEQEFGLVSPGYRFPLSWLRLDLVHTEEGFKVVDINTIRSAGMGDMMLINQVLDECFSKEQVGVGFPLRGQLIKTVEQCLEEWGQNHPASRNTTCQVITSLSRGDWHNCRIMGEFLAQALRKQVVLTEREELSGDSLGNPIIIGGRVVEGKPGFSELANVYPHGACIMPPLFRSWMSNKHWFLLPFIHPYQWIFQKLMGESYQVFERVVPQTGVVRGGHIQFPDKECSPNGLAEEVEWIFKPPAGSSARGIHLSSRENRRKWARLLEQASSGVLQRYYPSKEICLVMNAGGECAQEELYTKYGLFIYGGELAGVEFMASTHPIVHGGRNAYYTTARIAVS